MTSARLLKIAAALKGAGRPSIRVEPGKLVELAVQGEDALLTAGMPIFRRDTFLVRPAMDEVDAAHGRRTRIARLVPLSKSYLRGELCRAAIWERFNLRRNDWTPINPPDDVAELILARYGHWRLPPCTGVITCPTLRPDGSVLVEEGYDAVTRLYLMSPPTLSLLPRPTPREALEALTLLKEVLVEFPFIDGASESVALSAMISTVARGLFPVVPMHVARSPAAGSGKSHLWDVAAMPSTGQFCPVMAAGPNETETEKRLGSALMAGQALVSIDNVNGELGGVALCQAIERPVVQIRILGRSELFRIEARGTTIFATGNNLILTGDVVRRSLTATLDPKLERPELREFKNNPIATILVDRPKYIAACLTIVRAYIEAGQPNKAPRLASFEQWSDTVRSGLMWLGCADPVATMETARNEDPHLILLRQMLSGWTEAFGVGKQGAKTVAELVELLGDDCSLKSTPAFRAALGEAGGYRGKLNARTLAWWFKRNRGVISGGRSFDGKGDHHGLQWWVQDTSSQ